jgi:hypothetical protein
VIGRLGWSFGSIVRAVLRCRALSRLAALGVACLAALGRSLRSWGRSLRSLSLRSSEV